MTISASWLSMVERTARQALALAGVSGDVSPAGPVATVHRPAAGQRWVASRDGAVIAEALLDRRDASGAIESALGGVLEGDPVTVRVVDALGHSRPVYGAVLAWMMRRAGVADQHAAEERLLAGLKADDVSHACWRALLDGESLTVDERGPVHVLGHDDLLDAWTYRELVALHVMNLAAERGDEAMRRRVAEVAAYHQVHTQPDYTTYQPWALAAFARDEATRPFAEQQLHDVQTHLAIEGGLGAGVIAMLLVDAMLSLRDEAV